jgi:hypothetical protein
MVKILDKRFLMYYICTTVREVSTKDLLQITLAGGCRITGFTELNH